MPRVADTSRMIYDRHFTPPVFSNLYVPAESVYLVMEVKQELTRANIIYAGKMAQSVRKLFRTNAEVHSSRPRRIARRLSARELRSARTVDAFPRGCLR